jgi:hypothetical protein
VDRRLKTRHNKELHDLHCLSNIVRVMGGTCSTYGEEKYGEAIWKV